MVSSDLDHADEDNQATSASRRAPPPPFLQYVREHASQSPSDGLASPKRQASEDPIGQALQPKRRRLKAKLLDSRHAALYEDAFGKEVDEFVGNDLGNLDQTAAFRAPGSSAGDGAAQYGAARWLPEEKAKLFHLLDRKGRHDLPALSKVLRKSEPEIAEYLRLLHDGYCSRHLLADDIDLYRYDEIPAAFEIGRDLEEALETAADQFAAEDLSRYTRRAVRAYGQEALIDVDLAIEMSSSAPIIKQSLIEKRGTFDFANNVLNLPNLLWLSESVFMNSKHDDLNWRCIAPNSARPSIFHTACIDLSNLVVSITERLVSTANFLALSRIRATESGRQRRISLHVRRGDVFAAFDLLGMPVNSAEYWRGCPRKCQLAVVECDTRNRVVTKHLSYDEVEQMLSRDSTDANVAGEGAVSGEEEEEERNQLADGTDALSSSSRGQREDSRTNTPASARQLRAGSYGTAGGSSASPRPVSVRSSPAPSTVSDLSEKSREEIRQNEEDSRVEEEDMRKSKLEETWLWTLLGHQSSSEQGLAPKDNTSGKGRKKGVLHATRKPEKDLRDWRDWCEYRSKWEQFPLPVHGSTFNFDAESKNDEDSDEHVADSENESTHQTNSALFDTGTEEEDAADSEAEDTEGASSQEESDDAGNESMNEDLRRDMDEALLTVGS